MTIGYFGILKRRNLCNSRNCKDRIWLFRIVKVELPNVDIWFKGGLIN